MKSNLLKRGFLSLVATQFFGAMNDNVLKVVLMFMVIDGAWTGQLGAGGQGIVGICFTHPVYAAVRIMPGSWPIATPNATVTMWVKIAEIPIAHRRGHRLLSRQSVDHSVGTDRADLPKFVLRSGQVRDDSRIGG